MPCLRLAGSCATSSATTPMPTQSQVQFTIPARNSRFWAIPLLGYVLKQIVLIPHIIVLFFVGVLVLLSQLVLWLSRLAAWQVSASGLHAGRGIHPFGRARIQAFSFGLTDQYPPFRLKD